jgi:hypothetical protein
MTALEMTLGVGTLLATGASGYMAMLLQPLKDKDSAHEKAIESMEATFDGRLKGLHDDSKFETEKLERRLADVERTYLSRTELTNALKEFRESLERSVDRMETSVRVLGDKVDHLLDRVSKVEATK